MTTPDADDAASDPHAEAAKLDYASALTELDAILAELEDDNLNVDVLAERVARASELITFCRTRITNATQQVEQIVTDLDSDSDSDTAS